MIIQGLHNNEIHALAIQVNPVIEASYLEEIRQNKKNWGEARGVGTKALDQQTLSAKAEEFPLASQVKCTIMDS